MNDSKISVRYARALFQSALEKNVLEDVRKDMDNVLKISTLSEFDYLVNAPVIKDAQKAAIMKQALQNQVHELTGSLVDLLIRNSREEFVSGIARNYIDLYKKHKNIRSATFTAASSVPDDIMNHVEKVIRDFLKSTVELTTGTDEELIGGFVLRIEDQQYDASVANSLRKVKKQLLKQ